MLTKDKLTLRNLVFAIVAGSGLALLAGIRWIGQAEPLPRIRFDDSSSVVVRPFVRGPNGYSVTLATVTHPPDDDSVRSSAGGIPVSTTTLTSAEWDASTSDREPPAGAPRPELHILQSTTAPPAPRFGTSPPPASATATASAPPSAPVPAPPAPTPNATPTDPPNPVTSPRTSRVTPDAAVASPTPAAAAEPPPMGAGRFTEPPPWAASAFTSDPNAGAGPFTTDWPSPFP